MNSYSSIQSPFDFAKEFADVLPVELTNKIFNFHNGLISPCALLIKNHMKENHMCPYIQLDYYIKHDNLEPEEITESFYDWWFITMGFKEGEKYDDLWFSEVSFYRLFRVTN